MNLVSKLNKTIIYIIISASVLFLLGRNNEFLGSALNLFRWLFIGILLFYSYFQGKNFFKKLNLSCIICVILLLFEWTFVQLSFHRLSNVDFKPDKQISIMSYIIFFKNKNPDSILEIIKRYNPDIILVQELTPNLDNYLKSSLGDYSFQETKPLKGTHGIGIYSKFKILENEFFMKDSNRPFIQCSNILIDFKKIRLCNAHLASPAIAIEDPYNFISHYSINYKSRLTQIGYIDSNIYNYADQTSPMIFAGDFNTLPIEPLYREIKKDWVDIHELAGIGYSGGFPNSKKIYGRLFTVDYFFIRGNIIPINSEVIKESQSDHSPILVKIKI